jgi:putative FmdB family regulatory protein
MPIYEYRRPDGSTFDVMQSFSEAPLTHDPETGVEVQRVLHAPAVHFKGSGFYNTDYGTKRRQRENGAEDGASSKDGASAGEKGAAADSGAAASGGSEGGKGASEGKTASKQNSTSKPKREPVGA